MNNLPAGTEYDINAPWNVPHHEEVYEWYWVPFFGEGGEKIFYSLVLFCDLVAIDHSDDIETCPFWEECLDSDYKHEFIKA